MKLEAETAALRRSIAGWRVCDSRSSESLREGGALLNDPFLTGGARVD